ncbi:MAG: YcxB family protein, partial [Myxococcota bacterium]
IFVYLTFPQMMYSQARSNARQMYEEGPMNGLIGRFEIVADDDGVEIISEMERHFYKWEALDRVVQTNTHTFVYVNGLHAYVIPHDSVYEGDPSKLVQAKQRRRLDGRGERAALIDETPRNKNTPLLDEDRRLEERIDRAAAQHDGTVDGNAGERKPTGGREPFENGAEGYI